MVLFVSVSYAFSQSVISEKQIVLTKEQKKHEPDFAIYNDSLKGVTLVFEPKQAPFVKGEKKKFVRYELQLDNELNLFSGDFRTVDTKLSLHPKIVFDTFSIAYYTWVDIGSDHKFNKMMLQIVQYDKENNVILSKSFELCDEKGFACNRISRYKNDLIVLTQYEALHGKDKNEKNKSHLLYTRINISMLELINQTDLMLQPNDDISLDAVLIEKDKLFIVGSQLMKADSGFAKIPKTWFAFRFNLDGTEEKRVELSIAANNFTIGSAFLRFNKDLLYLVGEFGNLSDMKKIPLPDYQSTVSGSAKCPNLYQGMYVKKLDFDLIEKSSATFQYKEDVLSKMKKPYKNPFKKGESLNFQDFFFCDDGSFFISAEMYNKEYRWDAIKIDYYNNYGIFTNYNYLDGLIFKFNANTGLDWLVQIERDRYPMEYTGFILDKIPQDNGKLDVHLLSDQKLAVLYNTPDRKYSANRFGLSELLLTPLGDRKNLVEFTKDQQFELIDGGLVDLGNNEVLAFGTNPKTNDIWIKKIKISE